METQKPRINLVSILLIILLVTMIASMIFIVVTVTRTINAAISPIQTVNDALSTQVSQLMNPTPTIIPDPVTIIREATRGYLGHYLVIACSLWRMDM